MTNTIIESIGVYLPPRSFTTTEVLQDCTTPIRFPLEKISGIKTRRMAGQEEFSLDLAQKAIENCLEKSKYHPNDIDLLICCNISRFDGPDMVSFEPSTSIKLRKHFGFDHAIAFDITNACAGMFTAIHLVDNLLNAGAIRRAIIVSGEYITHLTQTAQKEIENFMDDRLACLTLGDAGAALLLEKGLNQTTGFQKIDLRTFGRYSPYCIAKVSEHGGWIMHTDSVNMTDVAIKAGAKNALEVLHSAGWPPDQFQHLIMHQTSRMTMNSARREINNLLEDKILHDDNTINNLEQRGNTASTSHTVALADHILNQRIKTGDKVVFCVTASGLTIGTALYTFDDLPDRFQEKGKPGLKTSNPKKWKPRVSSSAPGIRIEQVGIKLPDDTKAEDSLELLHSAATNCIMPSAYSPNDIGLIIHSGVYRDEYLLEPALAALLAGRLNMNATVSDAEEQTTLAFDVFNGAIGFLNACYLAQQMIIADCTKAAMIVAAECENNADLFPDQLIDIREAASAIIMDAHPEQSKGFSQFLFHYQTAEIEDYTSYCCTKEISPRLQIDKTPDLEEKYIAAIVPMVKEILQQEGLDLQQIDRIFPPQISSVFITRLSQALQLPREKFVDIAGEGPDLFSSSIPFGLAHAYERAWVKDGDIGLLIAVASGIQAGCAIYRF
ncbi:3-oxoacyl-[acyl-carrier-protein] synthase III C-terminal domain-containing protein [Lewinella cohaerens]|uniref:3-oxoacyl-[acyl-carrier-protein] synthase III C-terminal domain-containing protein n=1 Tax=Lewinella cohaerens TaxID=70995 RepID=UPI00036916E6|nr:3-oxoacyl-[acyl-carrier-protein] synthase III C-terminal domain-containing protein [Lewinella cohaerens]